MGQVELWYKTQEFDSDVELIKISTSEAHKRVLCQDYPPEGCVAGSGKRVKIRLVELIVIQYQTPKAACMAALKVGQYFAYNWLFDDVSKEPVLEDFVDKAYEAIAPKTLEDCHF